jgi:hypothetical protein
MPAWHCNEWFKRIQMLALQMTPPANTQMVSNAPCHGIYNLYGPLGHAIVKDKIVAARILPIRRRLQDGTATL